MSHCSSSAASCAAASAACAAACTWAASTPVTLLGGAAAAAASHDYRSKSRQATPVNEGASLFLLLLGAIMFLMILLIGCVNNVGKPTVDSLVQAPAGTSSVDQP